MSKRGIEFRDYWINENINADAFPKDGDPRVNQLTEQLVSDAKKEGINKSELEHELTEDLADYIHAAMDNAALEETLRLAEKND